VTVQKERRRGTPPADPRHEVRSLRLAPEQHRVNAVALKQTGEEFQTRSLLARRVRSIEAEERS
jgi:hypothetical protein